MTLSTGRRRNVGARGQQQQRWMAGPQQRWGPFRELEELQHATAQLLDNVISSPGEGAAAWVPAVDIIETDDSWIIMAELPGVRSEDIVVEVDDNELAITGEIREREREGILRRRARRTGAFEFRVTLPGQVNTDAMEAMLDDGILTVVVPKPEEVRPQRVEVQSGTGQSSLGQSGRGEGAMGTGGMGQQGTGSAPGTGQQGTGSPAGTGQAGTGAPGSGAAG
jgi:HSP20 family protein